MEIREGYKQTEIGVIPEDWDCVELGDIGECIIGLTYKPSDVKKYGRLVLRSSNINDNRLVYTDNVYVDAHIEDKLIVKENDILICVRNGSRELIGKCAIIDKKATKHTFGAFMSVFRSKFGPYLFNCFQSGIIKKQINAILGATINQITNKDLKSFFIPFPKLPEQQAIATALSDIDGLINSLQKLIDKKKKIKQGAMQELLTGKRRLEGFSGEWEERFVLEFGTITTGSTPSTLKREYWNGSITWVTPTDIGEQKYIATSERQITESGLSVTRKLEPNTVLITCIASIGKNAILRKVGACNQQINAITPTKDYNSDFLYYLFEIYKPYLLSKAGITATNIVSKSEFSLMCFKVPPTIEEQTAIANILSDMDSEIEALERKLNKYKDIKQGMMQELLTGRIRLLEEAVP
jgi:type I restriction enzyme S subunit